MERAARESSAPLESQNFVKFCRTSCNQTESILHKDIFLSKIGQSADLDEMPRDGARLRMKARGQFFVGANYGCP